MDKLTQTIAIAGLAIIASGAALWWPFTAILGWHEPSISPLGDAAKLRTVIAFSISIYVTGVSVLLALLAQQRLSAVAQPAEAKCGSDEGKC